MKATYALDETTVQALEKMAQRWAVSKSEALRRAIRAAAAAEAPGGRQHVDRLDRLQRALALSPASAKAWVREVRAERRAGSPRSSGKERR
ncbi:MAG: ribbon-helix-helix protein, CopG family [Candidatus Binatia bacterium]